MNERTSRYRDAYRAESIPSWYSGWVHFGVLLGSVMVLVGFAVSQLEDVASWTLGVAVFTFFFANFAEYMVHRHPMHHRFPGPLGYIFRRHAGMHHAYYTHETMQIESHRDLATVLFPLHLFFVFFGVIAAPVALAIGALLGSNAAWVFVITCALYYQIYEFLHVAYHLDPDGVVGRLPGMKMLRQAHTLHHDPRVMAKVNFNISFPVFDRVFRTFATEEAPAGWSADQQPASDVDSEIHARHGA